MSVSWIDVAMALCILMEGVSLGLLIGYEVGKWATTTKGRGE